MKRFLGLTTILLFLGVGVAQAQITYTVTTVPTFVIESGMAEVLGGVRITASNTGTTVASTINYFYSTPCDNNTGNGITLTVFTTGALTATFAATTPVTNTGGGCIVAVTVPGALAANAGDYIEIDGVRGRVALTSSVAGSIITATLTATPSNSSFFTVPNVGNVAISEPGYTQAVVPGVVLQCVGTASPNPTLTITEGFNAAFVDYDKSVSDTAAPLNERPVYGATNNTQVHINLSNIISGITLVWPTEVDSTQLGVYAGGVGGSALMLNVALTTSTDIYYDYVCGNQGTCDLTTESFPITPTLTDTTTNYGTEYEQTQLWPDIGTHEITSVTKAPYATYTVNWTSTPSGPAPRFVDPLSPVPAAPFASNEPCHTDLLFPWVAYVPALGYDTGIAIANTSTDPFGLLGAGGTQTGSCTLNGYNTANVASPTGFTALSYTTPVVASGATWAGALSATSPFNAGTSFEGYIIAVCNFQFGHGSAQISDNLATSSGVVYGYTALIIPDPTIVGGRFSQFVGVVANSGETLAQ